MNIVNLSRSKFVIAACFGLGTFFLANMSAQASVTSQLSHCTGSTKVKVVSCCTQILKKEKKPIWFTENKMSCGSAVVCTAPVRTPKPKDALVDMAPVSSSKGGSGTLPTIIQAPPKKKPTCFFAMPDEERQGTSIPTAVTRLRGQ